MPRNHPHILLRLRKRRHPAITLHHLRPSVISRQRQPQIPAIAGQQILQITRPRINVFRRIKNIRDGINRRRCRQKLHQSLRPLARNRPRIKIRFHRNHPVDQTLIHSMLFRRRMNQIPKRSRRNRRSRNRREMFLRLHSHQISSRHAHRPAIHRQTYPLPIALIASNMQPRSRPQYCIVRRSRRREKPRGTKQHQETRRRK